VRYEQSAQIIEVRRAFTTGFSGMDKNITGDKTLRHRPFKSLALIRQKRIASKVLRTHPHNIGGLRLISTESLRALIEASSDE